MLPPEVMAACADELVKIAARVPFFHGTHGEWPVLVPGVGETVLKGDPNPRAVYTMIANRAKKRPAKHFADKAVQARGGEPVIAKGKMDTSKGWLPTVLSDWGKRNIGSVDEAQDLALQLDDIADKKARGAIWKKLQLGTGRWQNVEDAAATLKPTKYVPA